MDLLVVDNCFAFTAPQVSVFTACAPSSAGTMPGRKFCMRPFHKIGFAVEKCAFRSADAFGGRVLMSVALFLFGRAVRKESLENFLSESMGRLMQYAPRELELAFQA
jgi:hypothetical protein